MPLQIPSLAETRGLSRDFLAARLAGYESAPANNRARVLSDGNGALAFGAYQYLVQLALMFLPDTAIGDWLDRWANIWGVPRQAATFAEGSVTVIGIEGTILPDGTQLAATGITFETIEEITVGTTATPVHVRALTAGIVGNLAAGASLSLTSAIAGVDGTATVASLTGGVEAESDDLLRERVLFRIQKPPMGGDADDYIAWAREVPGVTRVWTAPNEQGPGTVTVRFMMDQLRVGNAGFPLSGDVAAVQAHIETKRPVTVRDFFVTAPIPEPISFTISDLDNDTPSTRAAIAVSVAAMLADRAAPARAVGGVKVDAQTIHREWVSAAILAAAGVDSFDLTMVDHAMPDNGRLAVLGTITYT